MIVAQEEKLIALLKDPATRPGAFDTVVLQYQEVLYYHVRRMVPAHADADDVLQNAFLKAWKNIEKFRGDASLKTWLYRIATNEALTFLNGKKRRFYSDLDDLQDNIHHSGKGHNSVDGEEIQKKLMRAIASLPERQRLVFNMRYFDEMKYDEIATVLEVSVGGLKANYHHAVKKIEKFLTG